MDLQEKIALIEEVLDVEAGSLTCETMLAAGRHRGMGFHSGPVLDSYAG